MKNYIFLFTTIISNVLARNRDGGGQDIQHFNEDNIMHYHDEIDYGAGSIFNGKRINK